MNFRHFEIVEGDFLADGGVKTLYLRGPDRLSVSRVFARVAGDFAHLQEEIPEQVWASCEAGETEPLVALLREATDHAEVPTLQIPKAVVQGSGPTCHYTTASGGCGLTLDLEMMEVGFEKLAEGQGNGPYSYMRASGFLNALEQEDQRQ